MADRKSRDVAILAKVETTYGTNAAPAGGANAILASNFSINPLNANNVPRDLIRPDIDSSEDLVGSYYSTISYDVEYQGSGTAGTAPAVGALLRGCGFSELVDPGNSVTYATQTNGIASVTQEAYDSGVRHRMLGSRGTFDIKAGVGERPVFSKNWTGLYVPVDVATAPSLDFSGWKKPLVVNDANSGDVTIGGTLAGTAVTGGTSYPSTGLQLSLGAEVNFTELLGGQTVDYTRRNITGKVVFDLTPAQEVSFMQDVLANTTRQLSWVHGTVAGFRVLLVGANVQFLNPTKEEINGKRLIGFDLKFTPLLGNDALKLIFF